MAFFENLASAVLADNESGIIRPSVVIEYEGRDITADIKSDLLSLSYQDFLDGQSDELSIALHDKTQKWLNTWYPSAGDVLAAKLGDNRTGLIDLGEFEITEIEYNHPPSVLSIKALSAGIKKDRRTLRGRAYENTTLKAIVEEVAARLKMKVIGTIAELPILRVTQYQERDTAFLARLAKTYGYIYKTAGDSLVFMPRDELTQKEAICILNHKEIKSFRFRDLIKDIPVSAEVSAYDAHAKNTIYAVKTATPRRANDKQTSTADTLKITANKGESQAESEQRAIAALTDIQDDQIAGSLKLVGNATLVAGQMVQLSGLGKLSGKYLINRAFHQYDARQGFMTEIDVKMIEYRRELE